jgi:hypothetical protein
MTKNLALAASIAMLVAMSGQALAATAAPNESHWSKAAGRARAVHAFNAFDTAMPTQTTASITHRYEGGPKSND